MDKRFDKSIESKRLLSRNFSIVTCIKVFLLALNIAGVPLYLHFASKTWNLNCALGNFLEENSTLCILLQLFCIKMNLTWLVVLIIQFCQPKLWIRVTAWIIVVTMWGFAYQYDRYRSSIEAEKAGLN